MTIEGANGMAVVHQTVAESRAWSPSWAWVHVVIAAAAMVATLPGRTHGLGLITEPLLHDLHLDRVAYADLNLWATLLGGAFCVPWGGLIDRLGTRRVLTTTLAALGAVVLAMSRLEGEAVIFPLFILVLLTRGLGQSALSVVSLALLGKSVGGRSGPAVGVYSFLTALGFMAAFRAVKFAFEQGDFGWRELWAAIGWHLIALAPMVWLLVHPSTCPAASLKTPQLSSAGEESLSLGHALRTLAFWVFGLAISLYGMIAAGVSLFNQSILKERGFERDVFLTITTFTPLISLASNLATGWLASRWSLGHLLAVAMAVLTAALLTFPFVQTLMEVYLYAAALGLAGGMITVLFFSVWRPAFGPAHLGKIQGAAQMLTVFASALGPELLARCQRWTGSYIPLYQYFAVTAGLLALAAWWTPLPRRSSSSEGSLL
jgi:MFS family permease